MGDRCQCWSQEQSREHQAAPETGLDRPCGGCPYLLPVTEDVDSANGLLRLERTNNGSRTSPACEDTPARIAPGFKGRPLGYWFRKYRNANFSLRAIFRIIILIKIKDHTIGSKGPLSYGY